MNNEDRDLAHMDDGRLLKEVAMLTHKLGPVDSWRLRRARAMRLLRARNVTRRVIAEHAQMSQTGVRNTIRDLERKEPTPA